MKINIDATEHELMTAHRKKWDDDLLTFARKASEYAAAERTACLQKREYEYERDRLIRKMNMMDTGGRGIEGEYLVDETAVIESTREDIDAIINR